MQGKLIIVLEGGLVSAVVGTGDLVGGKVTVIDYDTHCADEEDLTEIEQSGGGLADAFVANKIVTDAEIPTDSFPEFAEAAKPGSINDAPNDTVDALVAAEAFVVGFEDDDMQEGIGDLLAGLRAAIERERKPALPGAIEAFFVVAEPAMAEFGDYRIDGLMKEARREAEAMRAMLRDAVAAWPQFDVDNTAPLAPGCIPEEAEDDDANGGDMVEWFGEWREKAKALIAGMEGNANG